VTRAFGKPDVTLDYGLEDLIAEVFSHVFGDEMGQTVTCVEHGQEDARQRKRGIEPCPDQADRVQQVAEASMAKYSHWSGTITLSAATRALTVRRPKDGGQSMITNHNVVSSRAGRCATFLSVFERYELDLYADEVLARGDYLEGRDRRADDDVVKRYFAD